MRSSGESQACTGGMRAIKEISIPLGKCESFWGGVSVLEHGKGCMIATRMV